MFVDADDVPCSHDQVVEVRECSLRDDIEEFGFETVWDVGDRLSLHRVWDRGEPYSFALVCWVFCDWIAVSALSSNDT